MDKTNNTGSCAHTSIRSGGGKPCRFGAKCRHAASCRFDHPMEQDSDSLKNVQHPTRNTSNPSRGLCKYGERCTRPGCRFDHPTHRPPSKQKPQKASIAITGTSYEVGRAVTSLPPSNNHHDETRMPYRFCSQKECEERQELGQVSIFEATVDTAMLPPPQRQLDPWLAISQYRRSAAGTEHAAPKSRNTLQLLLEHLGMIAATRRPPTPSNRPGIHQTSKHSDSWTESWAVFLVDRLRACQADATRLFGNMRSSSLSFTPSTKTLASSVLLPSTWHVLMARIVIWVRYWSMSWRLPDKSMEQTLNNMLSTAFDHYWSTLSMEKSPSFSSSSSQTEWRCRVDNSTSLDDEMLCYAALIRLAQSGIESSRPTNNTNSTSSLGTILLDYARLVPSASSGSNNNNSTSNSNSCREDYPLFQEALHLTACVLRQEYYSVLHTTILPILARCCLVPALGVWRYRQCQQYNVSFAKEEAVDDLDLLLQIVGDTAATATTSTTTGTGTGTGTGTSTAGPVDDDSEDDPEWSPEYVQRWFGLPIRFVAKDEETKSHPPRNASFAVVFKQMAMAENPPPIDTNGYQKGTTSTNHSSTRTSNGAIVINDGNRKRQRREGRDEYWVFGPQLFDKNQIMRISDEQAQDLIFLSPSKNKGGGGGGGGSGGIV